MKPFEIVYEDRWRYIYNLSAPNMEACIGTFTSSWRRDYFRSPLRCFIGDVRMSNTVFKPTNIHISVQNINVALN